MARHLRCFVRGGWYHITTRGVGRREIFGEDRDGEHFVELLGELVSRYGVVLHAYVLMENHYHLLIETPHGNASRALQWLNTSYVVWYNTRHGRAGQLLQGRYKSIPIQGEGGWALTCSIYLHLNPVRLRSMGLGKSDRAAERAGVGSAPEREAIERRLDALRGHRWSSYPAYAGYVRAPEWLTRESLWQRVARNPADAPEAYRREIEAYLAQGIAEGRLRRLTQAIAIGSTAFVEKLRRKCMGRRGSGTPVRCWRRLLPFGEIRQAVEEVKQAPWKTFVDARGDWGRDLALYLGRQHAGLTLAELGRATGMGVQAVSKAATRMRERIRLDAAMRRRAEQLVRELARRRAGSAQA